MDKRDKFSFLAERGVQIGVAIGILAVGGLIASYIAYKKDEAQPSPSSSKPIDRELNYVRSAPPPTGRTLLGNSVDPRYKALTINLRTMVQREKDQGALTERTIMAINEGLVLVAQKDFAQSIVNNRKQRRVVRSSNIPKYIEIVKEGTFEIEEILMRKLNQVLADVECTQELYERSNQEISQRNPQFAFMSLMLIERMKASIETKTDISKVDLEKAREILRFQIQTYPTINIECPEQQLLPLIKQSWLGDLTFEKFGIEDEDLVKIPGIKMDQTFRELAMQLQSTVQKDAMGGGFF